MAIVSETQPQMPLLDVAILYLKIILKGSHSPCSVTGKELTYPIYTRDHIYVKKDSTTEAVDPNSGSQSVIF